MTRPSGKDRCLKVLCGLGLAAAALGGCANQELIQARAELRQLRQQDEKLKSDLQATRQVVVDQQKQIETLRGLGDKRLELLFHVAGIRIGKYTGGTDSDGQIGDDGMRVYLRPVDRDGHALKAAGDIAIQLFDLAAEDQKNLLGEYQFPVDEIGKYWSAGFMTYHYRFDLPWKSGPPDHPEVTVRVVFTDYLTGKQFTDQKVCTVRLPPAK